MTLRLAVASTASLTGAKHCVVCWQLRVALFADARAEGYCVMYDALCREVGAESKKQIVVRVSCIVCR